MTSWVCKNRSRYLRNPCRYRKNRSPSVCRNLISRRKAGGTQNSYGHCCPCSKSRISPSLAHAENQPEEKWPAPHRHGNITPVSWLTCD